MRMNGLWGAIYRQTGRADKSAVAAINRALRLVATSWSELYWALCLSWWGFDPSPRTRTSTGPPIDRRVRPLSLRTPLRDRLFPQNFLRGSTGNNLWVLNVALDACLYHSILIQ